MRTSGALLLSFVLVGFAAGCGKSSQPPPSPPAGEASSPAVVTNAEESPPTVPGEAPALPTASTETTAPQASGPPNLDQLTLQLHHWIGKNQRLPRNFEEFAASSVGQIPPPPAGKKYTINSQWRVMLADR